MRIVLAITIIGLVVWFFGLTNDPRVRYKEYKVQQSMIFGQEGPVDMVAIGSSRSMRVFNANELSKQVEVRHGYKPVVYDLSRSWPDLGHMTVFVRDMIENRDLKIVLVEFKEHQSGFERHPYFPVSARVGDVFGSVSAAPSKPLFARLHTLTRDLLDRFQIRLSDLLSGDNKLEALPKPEPAKTTDPSPTWFKDADKLEDYADKKKDTWKDDGYRSFDLNAPEEERNLYYVKQLAALAQDNGVHLAFYNIPRMYDMPFSGEFIAQFEAESGAKFIQLPLETLEELYPEGYTDPTHPGDLTMKSYMKYLAEELPWEPRP